MDSRLVSVWLAVAVSVGAPSLAQADEPWLLTLEGSAAGPMTAPQRDRFGWGGSAAVSLFRSLAPAMGIGARFRAGVLSDGPAPADPTLADPGLGGFVTLQLGARLRLAALWADGPSRGDGLFVEALGGGAVTGDAIRPALEVGLGYAFELGDVALGPVVRWTTIFETSSQLESRPANLLLLGVELTLLDAREAPPEPAPAPAAPATDSRRDDCPDEAEDVDGFQDEDGCPDLDDDGDQIPDLDDRCPRDAEDFDLFEDTDGCPDPDNDGDAILDIDDACPMEREVVNGVDDRDGCPDEGLIELIDDRIVLDMRVLFDFERARLRRSALPILEAIVELCRQHPEWVELSIEGHADRQGPRWFNQRLSERRARRVRDALVELGVTQSITSVGYGEDRPRVWGDRDGVHQLNRRVEFVVVRRAEPEGGAR